MGGSLPTSKYNLDAKGKPTRDPGVAVLRVKRNKGRNNKRNNEHIERLIINILAQECVDTDKNLIAEITLNTIKDAFKSVYGKGQESLEKIFKSLKGDLDVKTTIEELNRNMQIATSEQDPEKKTQAIKNFIEKVNQVYNASIDTRGEGIASSEETNISKAGVVLDHLQTLFSEPMGMKFIDSVRLLETLNIDTLQFKVQLQKLKGAIPNPDEFDKMSMPDKEDLAIKIANAAIVSGITGKTDTLKQKLLQPGTLKNYITNAKSQQSLRTIQQALETRKRSKSSPEVKQGPVSKKSKKPETSIPVNAQRILSLTFALKDKLQDLFSGDEGVGGDEGVQKFAEEIAKFSSNLPAEKGYTDVYLAGEVIDFFKNYADNTIQ